MDDDDDDDDDDDFEDDDFDDFDDIFTDFWGQFFAFQNPASIFLAFREK